MDVSRKRPAPPEAGKPPLAAQPSTGAASRALAALAVHLDGRERITIGDAVRRLRGSGFALALIVLAVPPLVPIPGPLGMIFGVAIVILAAQMVFGARRPVLPAVLAERTLPARALKWAIEKALPAIGRAERLLRRRRWPALTGRRARVVVGLFVGILGLALAVPVPFGNIPPVAAVVGVALSLAQRDGLALIVACGSGLVAVAWVALLVAAGFETLVLAWAALF